MKLLVVEDNEHDRSLIKSCFLTRTDIKFDFCSSLKEAIKHVNNGTTYSLILLDLNILDSDGIETFEVVNKFTDLPIIVMTGSSDENLGVEAISKGAADFFKKEYLNLDQRSLIKDRVLYALAKSSRVEKLQKELTETFEEIKKIREQNKASFTKIGLIQV